MQEIMAQFFRQNTNRTGSSGMPAHHRFRFDILRNEDIIGVNPVCDRVQAHWWRIKPAMGLPKRQDIKLAELRQDSAYISILDIEGGSCFEHDFTLRVRLIGTAVTEHFGEITGKDVAEMEKQASARRIYTMASLAIQERQPVMSVINAFVPEEPYKDAVGLYMPLADEAGEVNKILVAAYVSYFTDQTPN